MLYTKLVKIYMSFITDDGTCMCECKRGMVLLLSSHARTHTHTVVETNERGVSQCEYLRMFC